MLHTHRFARSLLYVVPAFTLLITACADSSAQPQTTGTDNRADIRSANTLLAEFGGQELARTPETASRLGLAEQLVGYDYHGDLDDRSQAGYERARLQRLEMLERMSRLAPIEATERRDLLISVETARFALQSTVEMASFGHGQTSLGFARPYSVDQLSGAYTDLPDLLMNRQLVGGRKGALNYLERLSRMADAIDDDRRRLLSDQRAGIVPPDFILARMVTLSRHWIDMPGEPHPLVDALGTRARGTNQLNGAERLILMRRADGLLKDEILPAYERFHDTLLELMVDAPATPGIWAIPNGDDYYQKALEFYTGQPQEPEALYQRGVALVAELSGELDIALIEAGFVGGTVGERLVALGAVPGQIYENTPEGQDALLAALSDRVAEARVFLSEVVPSPPRTPLTVLRVPAFLQANSPGGYYASPPADGSAPGFFFINLRDTAEWPAFTLPTLLYHEAIPGHHLESALLVEQTRLPLIRQLIWLPAYGEGWALYAEDLADELGLYDNDPLGRIGYLQSLLFRASRLVADTGLHYKRWGREQAIAYLVETTGQSYSAMETEIDRYTVWPGQAVSYMVGREFIWELRRRAERVLGDRFSLQGFHHAILAQGPRPSHLIEADVDAWIDSALAERR